MKTKTRLLASLMTTLTLLTCLAVWGSVGLANPTCPTIFARPVSARPVLAPSWSYDFARSPESALNALNGGSSDQTIRGPEISATVKDGRPVFHIFYQPYYNAQATWKWQLKRFTKLNEVLDFLSYKNASKSEPSHGQMKVVMVTVGGVNQFYIFYNNNSDAGAFAKEGWSGFVTTTPDNVLAGINQSSVGGGSMMDYAVSKGLIKLPDLRIKYATIINQGKTVRFCVENIGEALAGESKLILIAVAAKKSQVMNIKSLTPGSSFCQDSHFSTADELKGGVTLYIDRENAIKESNENNNLYTNGVK
jgi:hypothetical protein